MPIDLLLLRHGPSIALLAVIACAALGALAWTLRQATRALRATRAFRARAKGARRGIARAGPGDRVLVVGRLEAIGEVRAVDGARCAVTSTACGGAQADERATVLAVRAGARRIAIVGTVSVDAGPGARTLRADALDPSALVRLADAEVHPDLGPIASRAIAAGDHVAILGRVEPVAADDAGYRSAAQALAIAPDDDGAVHALGLGAPLALAGRTLALGALVGALVPSVVLAFGAPMSLGPARTAVAATHSVPLALWLPLSYPPTRDLALERTSTWVTSELATCGDDHLVEIARALRPLSSDCEREAWLAIRRGDTVDEPDHRCEVRTVRELAARLRAEHAAILRSSPHEVRPPEAQAAAAPDDPREALRSRAREWGLPAVAPSAGVDRPSRMYEMPAALLRSRRDTPLVSAMVRAWLRDVALFEAALGHDDRAHDALRAARTIVPSVDDVVVGVALVLASRADLRAPTWWSPSVPPGVVARIAADRDDRPVSYERDVLVRLADSAAPPPRCAVGESVALLRAAGAAYLSGARVEGAWLAERAIRAASTTAEVDAATREALFAALR